jgi:tRNA nucleotidyltransferase/poly(A) polymerase
MKEYKKILVNKINEDFFRYKVNDYKALKTNCTAEQVGKLIDLADNTDIELFYTVHDLFEICIGNKDFTILSEILNNILRDLDNASFKFKLISSFLSKDIIEVLQHSENSCLVGGCVRDILIDKTPKDFDFVTDIPYEELEKLFINAGFTVKEEGKQFLVMIVSKDNVNYEIANYRKDGTYVDGRRPESVEIGTIYDDAERRDFTVNALYFNLTTRRLIDPTTQGLNDIKSKTLRFVGKPKDRIKEDYLRAWRFMRFVSVKGFNPDKTSYKAIKEMWDDIYKKSNSQRVLQELDKIIKI